MQINEDEGAKAKLFLVLVPFFAFVFFLGGAQYFRSLRVSLPPPEKVGHSFLPNEGGTTRVDNTQRFFFFAFSHRQVEVLGAIAVFILLRRR